MNLNGLLDFSRPLTFDNGRGYVLYRQDEVAVLPISVTLPVTNFGLPEISLQLLRTSALTGNIRSSGILNTTLIPTFDLLAARSYLEQNLKPMRLQACQLNRGQIKFSAHELFANTEVADELNTTNLLNVAGSTAQQVLVNLSSAASAFWKQAILSGLLPIDARISYVIEGISPRFDMRLEFDPKLLNHTVFGLVNDDAESTGKAITYSQLVEVLENNLDELPFNRHEPISNRDTRMFAETIADHFIDEFILETSIDSQQELSFNLPSHDGIATGSYSWDLNVPLKTERIHSIVTNPFDSFNGQLTDEQLGALIDEKELPFIGRDKSKIFVYANLADQAESVLSMGAKIRQPATPPDRPVPLNKTLEFNQTDDHVSIYLHNNTDGSLQYSYQGFVVIETTNGLIACHGDEIPIADHLLVLSPNDFSVFVTSYSLDKNWFDSIDAEVRCSFQYDGRSHKILSELNRSDPNTHLLIPSMAEDLSVSIALTEIESGEKIETSFLSKGDLSIGPLAFSRCGKQTLDVVGDFSDGAAFLAVEVLPAGSSEIDGDKRLLHLTPSSPSKEISWIVDSPFKCGYQFRQLDQLGYPSHEWLQVDYPFHELNLSSNFTLPDTQNHQVMDA